MIRSAAFFIAVVFYAVFSSPTPDHLGWAEYVVAAALLVTVGFGAIFCITYKGYSPTLQFHRVFLLYMIIVPLLIGVMAGHTQGDILWDILPVLCLILPLLFYVYQSHNDLLIFGGVLIGTVFSLRYIFSAFPEIYDPGSLLYLANSPLIPFATIIGFHYLSDVKNISFLIRLAGLAILLVGLIAMILMMQGAPLGLTVVACAVIWLIRLPLKPILMIGIALCAGGLVTFFYSAITDVFESLSYKTMIVAWNNRLEEFRAVITQSSLWGQGWGTLWQSPAAADIWVRYTHNMASYYWLKAGVIGVLLAIGFVGFWAWQIVVLTRYKPAYGLAVAVPFIVHITIYTGFKTLDFAILLALAVALCPVKPAPTKTANQS